MRLRGRWTRGDRGWGFTVEERNAKSGRLMSCRMAITDEQLAVLQSKELAFLSCEYDVWSHIEEKGVGRMPGVSRRTYLKVSSETLATPKFQDRLRPCYLFVQNIHDDSEPRVGCSRKGSVHVS